MLRNIYTSFPSTYDQSSAFSIFFSTHFMCMREQRNERESLFELFGKNKHLLLYALLYENMCEYVDACFAIHTHAAQSVTLNEKSNWNQQVFSRCFKIFLFYSLQAIFAVNFSSSRVFILLAIFICLW